MAFKKVSLTPKTVNLGSGKLMLGGKPLGHVSDLKLSVTDLPSDSTLGPYVYTVKIGEYQLKVRSQNLADLLQKAVHVAVGDDNPSIMELKDLEGLIWKVDVELAQDPFDTPAPYGPLPEVPALDVKPKSIEVETGDEELDMLIAAAMDIASGLTTDLEEFHQVLENYKTKQEADLLFSLDQHKKKIAKEEKVSKTAAEIIQQMHKVGLPVSHLTSNKDLLNYGSSTVKIKLPPIQGLQEDSPEYDGHENDEPEHDDDWDNEGQKKYAHDLYVHQLSKVPIKEDLKNEDGTEVVGVIWEGPSGATYHRKYKLFNKNKGVWVSCTREAFLLKAAKLENAGLPVHSGICVVDKCMAVPLGMSSKYVGKEQTKYPKHFVVCGDY